MPTQAAPFRELYLFVEGPDDARFVNAVLVPPLLQGYGWARAVEYRVMGPRKVNEFLRTIDRVPGWDYVFFADRDRHPCASAAKRRLADAYSALDCARAVVVGREIECWYLAGLDLVSRRRLRVDDQFTSTDDWDKERFNALVDRCSTSRVLFMAEMLGLFFPGRRCAAERVVRVVLPQIRPGRP